MLLLALIYVAFISLGIPDSLLGSIWPTMHIELGVNISLAGVLSAVVCTGTVVSGLFSARLIARLGTARVTAISITMTAVAMLGIALSSSFWLTVMLCVPMGLGAGAVDAALNNYVAMHFHAKHMNWLHCFWGIGATAGPAIIGAILSATGQWRNGYFAMSAVQCVLAAVVFLSVPLWRGTEGKNGALEEKSVAPMKLRDVLRLPLAFPVFLSLLCYCGVEATMNLWGASYLATVRGISNDVAAAWVSTFFFGITLGRLLSGFMSQRLKSVQLIRLGILCSAVGIALLFLPVGSWLLPVSYFIIGLGFAPIYPAMLHETPRTFGSQASQSVMGIEMAFAYVGSTLLPPLLGALTHALGMEIMPVYTGLLVIGMLAGTEYVRKKTAVSSK